MELTAKERERKNNTSFRVFFDKFDCQFTKQN